MFSLRISAFGLTCMGALTAAALAWGWLTGPLQHPLERTWYQALAPSHTSATAQSIVRIDLDAADPRRQLIDLLQVLGRQKPAAVGLTLDLSRPSAGADRRWQEIRELARSAGRKASARIGRLAAEGQWLDDTDARLARAIRKTPGIYLAFRSAAGAADGVELTSKPRLLNASRSGGDARAVVLAPLPVFVEESSGVGDLAVADASPGMLLRTRVLTPGEKRWLPSLALLLAVKKSIGHTQSIRIDGEQLTFGNYRLPFDAGGGLLPGFSVPAGEGEAFPLLSADDVIAGRLAWHQLRNKVVLIGTPEQKLWPTPVGMLGEREVLAQTIAAIVDGYYFGLYPRAGWIQLAAIAAIALLLVLFVGRLPLWLASSLAVLLALLLAVVDSWLLLARHLWLPLATPLLLLVSGFFLLLAFRLFADLQRRTQVDTAHIRRDLGLLHQQGGNLDKALAVFRHLPADGESLELMYSLGKEFERKRRFHQAVSAYEWIVARDAGFRDAIARRDKARHLEAAGMTGSGSTAGQLLIEGMDHKPTLGRYEIEKMIGKGAMGEVYLGRDPSIDRVVAIKTLALADEFAPDELEEVRSRFFHEAAAAGRLNHTNIVTIYDVGEEHDLAFMAMEYIDGFSLDEHCEPERLLPMERVIAYIAQTAEALDYAHREGIVHRDVKPANLMVERRKDIVKITDFGIARITSHSRTKTGMLLGTPSYMSPEQAMGHKVDHRADIFSLGTTLYALLTGDKPFSGDSLASLFYQIINAPHPDIRKLNPQVSDTLKRIIDKALQKDPDKRYQSAAAFARALKRLKPAAG